MTYPEPGNDHRKTPILPNEEFEQNLRTLFSKNCKACNIYIYACGGHKPESLVTRQAIADRTGCTVYGVIPDPFGRLPKGATTIGDPGNQNAFCTMVPGVNQDPKTNCIGSATFQVFTPQKGKTLHGNAAVQ